MASKLGSVVEVGLGIRDIVIMDDDGIVVTMTVSPVSGVHYTVSVDGMPEALHIVDPHHLITVFKKAVVKRDGYWRG